MKDGVLKLKGTIDYVESSSVGKSSKIDFYRKDFERRKREEKAKDVQPKPEYFGTYHAEVFKDQQVVDAYHYRPPYPQEVFNILAGLITDEPRTMLDVGSGSGDIARQCVELVERVDAVDCSQAMIDRGKQLLNGDHHRLNWVCGKIEEVPLHPPYALITAGLSIHWTEWSLVFPRFRDILTPNGSLALITRDVLPMPWDDELRKLYAQFATRQDNQPSEAYEELERRGFFQRRGEKKTDPILFAQSVDDYVKGLHSRSGLSKERMGWQQTEDFDRQVKALLLQYHPDGVIPFQVVGTVVWGAVPYDHKKDIGTKVFEIARRNFLKYHLDSIECVEHEMQTPKLERGEARNLLARMVSDGGAIVSDVDHTLIDSTQRDKIMTMPKGFIEAAERLVTDGIPIAIVTGRTIDSTTTCLENGGATQALINKLEIYGEYGATYRGPSSNGKIIASGKIANLAKDLMGTIEKRISEDKELKEFTDIKKGGQPFIAIRKKMVGGAVKCPNLRKYLERQGASINVEEKEKFVHRKINEIISSVLKEREGYKAFRIDNNSTGIEIRLNADTKGTAAASLVKKLQLKSVVFYGDDMPDLDVPKALIKFIAVNKHIDGYIADRGNRLEILKKAISSLAPMENEIQARIEQIPRRNQLNEEFLSLHKNTLQSQAFVGVKHPQGMAPTEAAVTEASSIMLEGPDDAVAFIKEMTDEIMKVRKNEVE
jgi:HAD superfamily hydrolase (TIGR01484 family)